MTATTMNRKTFEYWFWAPYDRRWAHTSKYCWLVLKQRHRKESGWRFVKKEVV